VQREVPWNNHWVINPAFQTDSGRAAGPVKALTIHLNQLPQRVNSAWPDEQQERNMEYFEGSPEHTCLQEGGLPGESYGNKIGPWAPNMHPGPLPGAIETHLGRPEALHGTKRNLNACDSQ
jgi:hypothetical protein